MTFGQTGNKNIFSLFCFQAFDYEQKKLLATKGK